MRRDVVADDSLLVVAVGDVRPLEGFLPELARCGAVVVLAADRRSAATLLTDKPDHDGPGSPIRIGDLEVDLSGLVATWAGSPLSLTGSEFRMLVALAQHPGRVFSFAEITEACWGCLYLGDSAGIRSSIRRLRNKLAMTRETVTIQSARGIGFRLVYSP